MNMIEKLEPILIFGAIILGLLFKDISLLNNISPLLITVFLALMLFALFLDIPLEDIRSSFSNRKFTIISILIYFIWTPLFGYFLGSLFLYGHVDIFIGFFMLILTPCTDWYLLFTKISKGNVPLSLSILPINLLLQIILLPVYLVLFFSNSNNIVMLDLVDGLLTFIIIPFIGSEVVKFIFRNKNKTKEKITGFFSSCQILFLCIAIFGLFNTEASSLFENLDVIGLIFIPLMIFFIVNFILDFILSRQLDFNYENYVSLTLTTLARNSPLALAIAIKSFPNNELIAIALVVGPLIELPVLYIVSRVLLYIQKKY